MTAPEGYKNIREALPAEVSFGCGGIRLLAAAEIQDAQICYAKAADGASVRSGEEGAWQPNWFVIGYETGCGDPLFIDTANAAMPVFTAMHGEGAWNPVHVAISLHAFTECVIEFSRISAGRSNPVERESNPVTDEERRYFLRRVADLNESSTAPEFWGVLLKF